MSKKKIFIVLGVVVVVAMGAALKACSNTIKMFVVRQYITNMLGSKPPFTTKKGEVIEAKVKMRDGIELATRIHFPEGEGPWPTILVRDTYQFTVLFTCDFFVRYGYACVHQDTRGQGNSGGIWYPLKHETDDGEDTFKWLIEQPWQNDNLAMVGASYVGLVQWAVADRLPKQVKTLVNSVSHGDFYDMVYRGGQYAQAISGIWSAEIFVPFAERDAVAQTWLNDIVPQRPALDVNPEYFGAAWPAYKDYISHPERSDPYWNQPFYAQLRTSHRNVSVPVLWTARWHDFFLEGTLKRFPEMPTHNQSLLYIAPGQHAGFMNVLSVDDLQYHEFASSVQWLDHHLKGKPLPEHLKPGVLYHHRDSNTWTHAPSWPPETSDISFVLENLDASASCAGTLVDKREMRQSQSPSISYRYDPNNPVSTRGGAYLLNASAGPIEIAEQGDTDCQRDDVLSFTSGVIKTALRIAGGMKIALTVSSDAEDTAFTVKVMEVLEDGRVVNIRDDIISLVYRNGPDIRVTYDANQKVELEYKLVPIDWAFRAGSRIRLDISSSNSPGFVAHANIDALWSRVAKTKTATQTVYSGQLDLPLVR